MSDALRLAEPALPGSALPPWRVLVVDDDPEVHTVTALCLRDFVFEGRRAEVLSAHSASEARRLLVEHPDVALILLDVVMETERAGLDFARHVRDVLHNRAVRIVLRTGQPGEAPPLEVVERYEIDDYRTKTELTYERLTILTKTALRNYRLLHELELRERALSQSNEELERFTYVASHDLKTPLRGIVGFAQLLQRRLAGKLEDREAELLHFILQGAGDLQLLIENLLEFSRLGRSEIPPQRVELGDVVGKAREHLRQLLDERHAQVEVGPLPAVHGHPLLLEQLFRNLIENAIKYQPGEQPRVTITAAPGAEVHEIRVSDRGIGIEPQYLAQIFEPFRRLHTQDRFPGSGVGLATCRRVVQLHGGSIHAESVPGEGTTMVVRLPAKPVRLVA